ncbi:MAG: YdgA family protein [Burkholderiaceae bacterium]|nr:YdgA family protein [Burkholderiaceae bacterium]
MNKGAVVAGVVVLAGVAYVGSSWYVGQQAEAKIRASIEQTNREFTILGSELTSKGVVLSVKEYKRGIFSADAVYVLTLNNLEDGPVELSIADHLQHGPFPLDALKEGDFTPMLAYSQAHLLPAPVIQPWFDSQNAKSPLLAKTRIGMDGKGRSVWTLSPAEYAKNGTQVSFSGGLVQVDFSNDFKDSVSTGQFDSLRIQDSSDASTLVLNGMKLDGTAKRDGDKATLNSRLTMDKLALAGSDELTIDNVAITIDSLQTGKLLDGSIHYQLGHLTSGKADLGGVDFTFGAQKLDMAALSDLANTYEQMYSAQAAQDDTMPQLDDQQQALLQEKLFTLLASQPSLSANPIVWKNSAGESKASLLLDLAAPTDAAAALQDPMAALTQILKKLQLDVSVSRAMFIQAFSQLQKGADASADLDQAKALAAAFYDQYVTGFQEIGLLKATDEGATLALVYQNGNILMNGTEMSVQEFVMLMMVLAM